MATLKSAMKAFLMSAALAVATSTQAGLVNFSVTGNVDDALGTSTPNDFGLGLGSTITAYGSFDDTGLTGSGAENISLISITLEVGSVTMTEADDTRGAPYPVLNLQNGGFNGINFDANLWTAGFFNSAAELMTFEGWDDSFGSISGHWDANSFATSPVPVPAAVWLFGSGLLGLVGVARRKK